MKTTQYFRYLIPLVILTVFVIWLKPQWFGLIGEDYHLIQFRSDYKDLINILYVAITLWLVLVTKKTLEINLYAQKALNEPLIDSNLIITKTKPEASLFDSQSLKIHVLPESNYVEEAEGASVYLLIKNVNGFGKATKLKAIIDLEAQIPDKMSINRELNLQYLLANQAIALYLYRFENPSLIHSLKIKKIEISYTNPFDEASKTSEQKIVYDKTNHLLAKGDMLETISLGEGIKKNQ
ncbi:hypothetical protein [Leptospira bandrabouensis]|uniref:hypothetical protein n=1 Tax=Leptospira bandrabouensis TaxID=2484903 RepID=UPI001EEB901B|nr:hypothetical protein [Leptospira bandrabouensis]MCG6154112.1 hypothetical protein [Leptospira bandrabouensis]